MSVDHRENIHAGIVDVADDFHHFSLRIPVLITVAYELYQNLVAVYRSF